MVKAVKAKIKAYQRQGAQVRIGCDVNTEFKEGTNKGENVRRRDKKRRQVKPSLDRNCKTVNFETMKMVDGWVDACQEGMF